MTVLGDDCSVRVYQLFYCMHFPLINVRILFYRFGIIFMHSVTNLLKLCWHNRQMPSHSLPYLIQGTNGMRPPVACT